MVPAAKFSLSAILLVGPNETAWEECLSQLLGFTELSEIILSVTEEFKEESLSAYDSPRVKIVRSKAGRARQLNSGARVATGTHLWFIHADTHFLPEAYEKLMMNVITHPQALYYFDLLFRKDGPLLVILNQVGAWLRSRLLSLPFGDQALAISKENFLLLSGFNEDIPLAEDLYFLKDVKRHKIPIISVGSPVTTSARKYREHGWLKVTFHHLQVTLLGVLRKDEKLYSTKK